MNDIEKSFPKYCPTEEITGRCRDCEFAKIVYANDGWSFIGCYCEPHRGKWVAEIKDCPKKKHT